MLPPYTSDTELSSIKLIATDMDLTLLFDDKRMPEGMPDRIRALKGRGIVFCAASGRPIPALRDAFPESWEHMALIADNGGIICLDGKTIYRSALDVELYQRLLTRIVQDGRGSAVLCAFGEAYVLERDRAHHDEISTYYKTIHYVPTFDGIAVEADKVSIFCPNLDSEDLLSHVFAPEFGELLYVTCAGAEWIDFMNLGVDKGAAVRRLAERLNIDLADVAAFGDTHNDIPMLEIARHSFLVANAQDHMERHARYRCPSNTASGVPTVIDAILAAR